MGRTGKRFIKIYVLFFFCMALLYIPLYQNVLQIIGDSYAEAACDLLKTGISGFESDLQHIEAMAHSANSNRRISRIAYMNAQEGMELSDYFSTFTSVEDLRLYFAGNDLIVDCGFLFPNGIVLTNRRIHYSGKDFLQPLFRRAGYPRF